MHIVGADSNGYRTGFPLEVEAREGGIIEEIRLTQAATNPTRSPHLLDLALYDMVRRESNIELLLDTTVVDATVEAGRVVSATALRESTEEQFEIFASHFIDASGDSRLAVAAGNPYRSGREARSEFDEPHALEVSDHQTLGSTILFQAVNLGRPVPFHSPPWARKFSEYDLRNRPHARGESAGEKAGLEYGYWWAEWGGHLDTIADNDRIRRELLSIAFGIWDHIKNGGDHGAENWALCWVGAMPGKRESRRLVGHSILTELDVLEARDCDDAIAYGGWFMDLHPPKGIDQPDQPPSQQVPVPYLYPIPLSCCCSATLRNLFFAGRNISATHVAFASTRVMATCSAIGQGVGITAAYATKHRLSLPELLQNVAASKEIQQAILKQDGFIIGARNEDPGDLARCAAVAASSYQKEGEPHLVLDGYTRSVHGKCGVKPGRIPPGSHRWMSDPRKGLPATLTLSWKEPVAIDFVQITFDSGLHRWLSLTQNNAVHKRNIWDPQPETVKDYQLVVGLPDGTTRTIGSVRDNYLRLVRHRFPPVQVLRLHLEISATNGIDHARVVEIRCYGPQLYLND